MHQRDQRRDHDASALTHYRRELIGQRFARAGRHHRQGGLPGQHPLHHIGLGPAKGGEAEGGVERFERIGQGVGGNHAAAMADCGRSGIGRALF